jgi:hypothetical protein
VQASTLRLPAALSMSNIFAAGSELVLWEVTSCGSDGPYRLVMRHAHGSIIEYFDSARAALEREGELEQLFTAARGLEGWQAAGVAG